MKYYLNYNLFNSFYLFDHLIFSSNDFSKSLKSVVFLLFLERETVVIWENLHFLIYKRPNGLIIIINKMTSPAIKISNYEDCLIGAGQTFDSSFYIYSREKILKKIMDTSKCDMNEALAFFHNFININYGPRGPIFFSEIEKPLINV